QRLATEDPLRYSRWDAHQKQIAGVAQEIQAAQGRAAEEYRGRFEQFKQHEAAKFAERVPEIKDKTTRDKLMSSAVEVLRDLGFSDQELGQLHRGEVNLSLHDHRFQLLLMDGLRYRDAKSAAAKTVSQKKPVPPVQRPGVAPVKGAAQEATIKNLETKLDNARGTRNMLQAAAQLVAERRRAAR